MNRKMVIAGGIGLLSACASAPQPNASIESARIAVQLAESDPNVSKYAPLDLAAAQKDLAVAESAYVHRDEAGISQPAYLAVQTAKLAQARGSAKADDARVASGQAEREQIQLAAEARAAENAKAASDLEAQKAQAAKAARDLEAQKAARLQAEVDALKAKRH